MAAGAEVTGALANHFLLNSLPAAGAGLAGAAIDIQLLGKVAGFAVAINEIPQGGTALLDGTGQYLLDRLGQCLVALQADLACGAGGADTGHKQRFAGVDVTHTNHDAGVHNEIFDGRFAPATEVVEVGAVEVLAQGFRPQMDQQVVLPGLGLGPQQKTETTRVVVAQDAAIGKADIDMVVFARCYCLVDDAQAARHTQVSQQTAAGSVKNQVFSPPFDAFDNLPHQLVGQVGGNRPAQARLAHGQPRDPLSFNMGGDTAEGGFNFG